MAACSAVLLLILFQQINRPNIEKLAPGECMRDYSFIYTDKLNKFLAARQGLTHILIMLSSYLMDFIVYSGLFIFNKKANTVRVVMAFIIFFIMRQNIQQVFFMARSEGYLFSDPGIPSFTVPYHDTDDFFFSGHVGTCIIWMLENFSQGKRGMGFLCFFIMIFQWIYLTAIRGHFIIDLITGLMVAHFSYMQAEWMVYYVDVKILGLDRHKRGQLTYNHCKKCGWSNDKISIKMNSEEKNFLKKNYSRNHKTIIEPKKSILKRAQTFDLSIRQSLFKDLFDF